MNKQLFLPLLSIIVLMVSCNKEPLPPMSIVLYTTSASSVSSDTAICGGVVASSGGLNITQKGVCWSTSTNPTVINNKTTDGTGIGSFSSNISGLNPATNYYVRAYAITSSGTSYGNQITFTTLAALSTIFTNSISLISQTSAISGGNITSNGGVAVTQRGVCWNTTSAPTILNNKTISGSGNGSYNSNINGLTPNTTYFVRAFATNSVGTNYGNEISFTTSSSLASLNTTTITSIGSSTAISGGNITSSITTVTQKGVCWSTVSNPTIANNKTNDGSGIGVYSSNIISLSPSTIYYVRAYAINSGGTAYGNELSFTTATLATLTTNSITSILPTTAVSGGNITSSGGASITQRGVCWSTSLYPTITDNKTNDGTGTGSYTSSISGLSPNTTYYVRAYATNSGGTNYGFQLGFTTPSITTPSITTNTITSITQITGTSGGNITSNGGATVTQRGVCWNTSPSPTTSSNKTIDGTGSGSFASNITGLTPSKTYYVRAYATNSAGTSYGNELNFTTLTLGIPTLSSPTNGSTISCCNTNRTLSWLAVTGATSYEINISRTSTFTGTTTTILSCGNSSYPNLTGIKTATSTITNFCINPGLASNNGNWYWRVRAKNGTVIGSWSSTYVYSYTF